jgi:hypothetical protein
MKCGLAAVARSGPPAGGLAFMGTPATQRCEFMLGNLAASLRLTNPAAAVEGESGRGLKGKKQ